MNYVVFLLIQSLFRMSLIPHTQDEQDHDDSRLWIVFDAVHDGISGPRLIFPLQYITGRIMLNLPTVERTESLTVTCFGRTNVRFTLDRYGNATTKAEEKLILRSGKSPGEEFFGHDVIVERLKYLIGLNIDTYTTKDVEVLPGLQVFPFRFQIPEDSPSTFVGDHGSILYYIEVRLKRTDKTDIFARKEFRVSGMLDLGLFPTAQLMQGIMRTENIYCSCVQSGKFGFELKVNKSAFVASDGLQFIVVVQNSTRRPIDYVIMRLIETTLFRSTGSNTTTQHVLIECIGPKIGPASNELWSEDLVLPRSLLPTNFGSAACIIELDYMIEIRVAVVGSSKVAVGHLPVVVGTMTADDYDETLDHDLSSNFATFGHLFDKRNSGTSLHHTTSGLMKHRFMIKEEHLRYLVAPKKLTKKRNSSRRKT